MTDGGSGDGGGDALAVFNARLHRLYAEAGRPPLRLLQQHADRKGFKLAPSTSQNLLAGRSTPRWVTVEAFVAACVAHARTRRSPQLPPELSGSAQWRLRYDAMRSAVDESARPPAAGTRRAAARAAPKRGTAAVVPTQLPAEVYGFTGRERQLDDLDRLLSASPPDGRSVVISAVSGMAGVGKTALAVHWAHRVAGRFPDGQLYVNLRGFDLGGAVKDPAEAVRGFLTALRVPPDDIPADPDAQTALYRSLLTGRRMLVLLDNARDAAQVRPLLPGAPGCMALITSRNPMTSLVAAQGAYPLGVDLLSDAEAMRLLVRRIGAERVEAEPEAAEELVARCARLPLALAVIAARAATHSSIPLHVLADELRDPGGQLDALSIDDPVTDVRTVFSCSYRTLSPAAARLFRRLALAPGFDISTSAAASLAGLPTRQLPALLAELVGAHLVVEPALGRYTLHDLLRAYAAELASRHDTEDQRRRATGRILDHYLHTAFLASRLLFPSRDLISVGEPRPGAVAPEPLADEQQALEWLSTNHSALVAAVGHAAGSGHDRHSWQLAWALASHFDRRGHWHDWAAVAREALSAAERLDDTNARIITHRSLARACIWLGRFGDAHTHLLKALGLAQRAGDPLEQAHIHLSIAAAFGRTDEHASALEHAARALDMYGANAHRKGQALALNQVGWYHAKLGDYQQALVHCEQSLTLHRELGNKAAEAAVWDSLGLAHDRLGHHAEAVACFQRAEELFGSLGDRYAEAEILLRLGDAHSGAGATGHARSAWTRAQAILLDLGHPDAALAASRLDG